MKCPVCQDSLVRLPYEGVPLFHCHSCHGHLLYPEQVDAIKRRRDQNVEQLESEATEPATGHGELRCPRCRGYMKEMPSSRHSHVLWDHCELCDLVWLDAGELAKIQLEREVTRQAHDYQEMRDHWRNQSDAEVDDFQKQLARQVADQSSRNSGSPQSSSGWASLLNFLFLRKSS